jgi:hypothetical protein
MECIPSMSPLRSKSHLSGVMQELPGAIKRQ